MENIEKGQIKAEVEPTTLNATISIGFSVMKVPATFILTFVPLQ